MLEVIHAFTFVLFDLYIYIFILCIEGLRLKLTKFDFFLEGIILS